MTTISDVARRAGVSPVTVSRVINKTGTVSASTEQRVEQAIAELGYVPSGVAQSLRSKRTRSLALILPDIENQFWTTVARGVEDAAQSWGYSVLLCNTDENPAKQQRYIDVVIGQRVDGVIIAPYDSDANNLAKLRTHDIPTVVIDRRIDGWDVDTVACDSVAGARALVRHLIGLGHRQIAIITGPAGTTTASDRVAGYRIALTEAGLPYDERLVKYGEFRLPSGEHQTQELLDSGLQPTAIFAANNVIAVGVIAALEKRGLRVPHDIALVCFDDLPHSSVLFPFFTVAAQPVYETGVNAAQLLLSRLDSEVSLQPRHVVLPTRLIVRLSCGSRLLQGANNVFSLPLASPVRSESHLVQKLSPEMLQIATEGVAGSALTLPGRRLALADADKSDVNRLLRVLRFEEADRVPHLELWVTSRSVYEYVLEHELDYDIIDARSGGQSIAPEDHIEFAQRLGMDAVACNFSWRPNNIFRRASDGSEHYVGGSVRTWADLDRLEPPRPLLEQLNHLERYLRAAQGTGVGVVANFTSFFDSALLAVGVTEALYRFYDDRAFLERLMHILLRHQERVMRAVCDRFSDDLAFVIINDDIAHHGGLFIQPDMFMETFPQRMERLVTPVKERGKLVALHSDGRLDQIVPVLHSIGFDAIHPVEPKSNDIFALKQQWQGKLAFIGNMPTMLLAYGAKEEIEEQVRMYCQRLAPGGGWVLGSSTSIIEGIPPESFVTMIQAVHRYGRYGALGRSSQQNGAVPEPPVRPYEVHSPLLTPAAAAG